jgi:hypothetical protein
MAIPLTYENAAEYIGRLVIAPGDARTGPAGSRPNPARLVSVLNETTCKIRPAGHRRLETARICDLRVLASRQPHQHQKESAMVTPTAPIPAARRLPLSVARGWCDSGIQPIVRAYTADGTQFYRARLIGLDDDGRYLLQPGGGAAPQRARPENVGHWPEDQATPLPALPAPSAPRPQAVPEPEPEPAPPRVRETRPAYGPGPHAIVFPDTREVLAKRSLTSASFRDRSAEHLLTYPSARLAANCVSRLRNVRRVYPIDMTGAQVVPEAEARRLLASWAASPPPPAAPPAPPAPTPAPPTPDPVEVALTAWERATRDEAEAEALLAEARAGRLRAEAELRIAQQRAAAQAGG